MFLFVSGNGLQLADSQKAVSEDVCEDGVLLFGDVRKC